MKNCIPEMKLTFASLKQEFGTVSMILLIPVVVIGAIFVAITH